jgi:cephalosporin hydroxylase
MMQQIITELRPDYIIETGTYSGGTTLFYATVLAQVNPKGRIITIDIEPRVEKASKFQLWKDKIELITDSSVSPDVIETITERVKGTTVLITLDSLHTTEHVRKELELYSPLVSGGSYIVVQDTNGPGPRKAVAEFVKKHPEFEVDRSREKFLLTFYPSGYLKRLPSPGTSASETAADK